MRIADCGVRTPDGQLTQLADIAGQIAVEIGTIAVYCESVTVDSGQWSVVFSSVTDTSLRLSDRLSDSETVTVTIQ